MTSHSSRLSYEAIVKDVIDKLSEEDESKENGRLKSKNSDRGESLLLTDDTKAVP